MPIVPQPHGSYPAHPCSAALRRDGYALAAAHAASLADAEAIKAAEARLKRSLRPSGDAGPVDATPLPPEWWVLRRFIHEHCFLEPGSHTHYIDLEAADDAPGSSRVVATEAGMPPRGSGFRAHLYAWCRRQGGLPLPSLQGRAWAQALPDGAFFRDQLRVRLVYGLEWRREAGSFAPRLSLAWLVAEAAEVAVHVTALVLLPISVAYYALDAERRWAKTFCMPDAAAAGAWHDSPAVAASLTADGAAAAGVAGGVARCAEQTDFAPIGARLVLLGGSSPLPLLGFVIGACLVLAIASGLRLLLRYANPPHTSGPLGALYFLVGQLYGLLLLLALALLATGVGVILAFHVVGGIAYPLTFLPSYTAIAALIFVGYAVGSAMFGAARRVREELHKRFLRMLQPHLQAAYARAQGQLAMQREAASGKNLALLPERAAARDAALLAEGDVWENAGRGGSFGGGGGSFGGERDPLRLTHSTAGAFFPLHTARGVDAFSEPAAGRTLGPVDIYLMLAGKSHRQTVVWGKPLAMPSALPSSLPPALKIPASCVSSRRRVRAAARGPLPCALRSARAATDDAPEGRVVLAGRDGARPRARAARAVGEGGASAGASLGEPLAPVGAAAAGRPLG